MCGADTIAAAITDGGSDWTACEAMVRDKFPWVFFIRCADHITSLIVKDICKIEEVIFIVYLFVFIYLLFIYFYLLHYSIHHTQVGELVELVNDAQHWFNTHKTRPLVAAATMQHYNVERHFMFPSDTRFAGKLLQLKRFQSMKNALQSVVSSADYLRFQFEDDEIAPAITAADMWEIMDVIVDACGPLLLLLRLCDSNAPTLSKLRATVDLVKTKMVDTGNDTLTDRIAACFHRRAPELCSDMANAAYCLDPQFIDKSRAAPAEVMASFWKVARESLHIVDDETWRQSRRTLVAELAAFRMKTGGFALEDYVTDDACGFWVAAGCHAPVLQRLALRLCPLPCSSSEAERNWQELKNNFTKHRNRVGKDKMEKMVFVRRFLRLKRAMAFADNDPGYKEWVQELLQEAAATAAADDDGGGDGGRVGPRQDHDNVNDQAVFQDHIEPGEQRKINGKEPGEPTLSLRAVQRNNAAKSWLFEKYVHMNFVDKNPFGGPDDPVLEDEEEWEHRVITNVVWYRHKGFSVLTSMRGPPSPDQEHEKYFINESLLQMIRDSPHNTKVMASALAATTADTVVNEGAAAAASATADTVVRSV